jgi:hypothetical protein
MKKLIFALAITCAFLFAGCTNREEEPETEAPPPDPYEQQETARETYEAALERLETMHLELHSRYDSGGDRLYYIYFPEHDILSLVRAKFEAAGLQFVDYPPNYYTDLDGWISFPLYLFDEERRVGISHVSRAVNNTPGFSFGGGSLSMEAARIFATQHPHINVGVFFNPDEVLLSYSETIRIMEFLRTLENEYEQNEEICPEEEYTSLRDQLIAERIYSGRRALIDHLSLQAQEFLDRLQSYGVLPHETIVYSNITVSINAEPLILHASPVLIDDRTLVPMRGIFEALGFTVFWEPGFISAYTDEKTIEMRFNSHDMNIFQSGTMNTITLEVPTQVIDGRVFVPLRAVAEATGAEVEWQTDENDEIESINIIIEGD